MYHIPVRWQVQRLGVIMAPDETDPLEEEGVLNPGGVQGCDGHYYLFPRRVAKGNDSTIGRVRVHHDRGMPIGVERQGGALGHAPGIGGVEDPRVEWIPLLSSYVMTYTVWNGVPQPYLAFSRDLCSWITYPVIWHSDDRDAFNLGYICNKDALFLPRPVYDPEGGQLSWALLHRPMFEPQGIWISYIPIKDFNPAAPYGWRHSRPLAMPRADVAWEALKIGAGVAVPFPSALLLFYHGVSQEKVYSPGVMALDPLMPHIVLDRPTTPLFSPDGSDEQVGIVNNVVFPTAYELHGGDVILYYGAADARICAARLTPEYA